MQSTQFKAAPIHGTCPKCGSTTQIERGPAFTPFVHGEARSAPSKVDGRALPIESLAANAPSIRCAACDSQWTEEEIDPTTMRHAFLQAQYSRPPAAAKET
jgi:hypothetical protein